jgi:hypothetical protein
MAAEGLRGDAVAHEWSFSDEQMAAAAEELRQDAVAHITAGDNTAAIAALSKSLSAEPSHGPARLQLAMLHHTVGSIKAAIQELQRTLVAQPIAVRATAACLLATLLFQSTASSDRPLKLLEYLGARHCLNPRLFTACNLPSSASESRKRRVGEVYPACRDSGEVYPACRDSGLLKVYDDLLPPAAIGCLQRGFEGSAFWDAQRYDQADQGYTSW